MDDVPPGATAIRVTYKASELQGCLNLLDEIRPRGLARVRPQPMPAGAYPDDFIQQFGEHHAVLVKHMGRVREALEDLLESSLTPALLSTAATWRDRVAAFVDQFPADSDEQAWDRRHTILMTGLVLEQVTHYIEAWTPITALYLARNSTGSYRSSPSPERSMAESSRNPLGHPISPSLPPYVSPPSVSPLLGQTPPSESSSSLVSADHVFESVPSMPATSLDISTAFSIARMQHEFSPHSSSGSPLRARKPGR